jgi:uncharacterized protein (DUF362 family)
MGSLDNTVYISKSDYNTFSNLSLDLINNKTFFPQKDYKNICIKINLCDYRDPSTGATTDPKLLRDMILAIKKRYKNSNIYILENDASSVDGDSIFQILGFSKLEQIKNVKLINVAKEPWVKKKIDGCIVKEIEIPEIIEKSDYFINFSKLKINTLCKSTMSLKNLFGLFRVKRKSIYHVKLDKYIVDINLAIDTDLNIVDGIIGMEEDGPAFGIPKRCNVVIYGSNSVSVDSFGSYYMGFNPNFIKYLKLAQKKGLGSIKYKIVWKDENIKKRQKFKFDYIQYFALKILRGRIGI